MLASLAFMLYVVNLSLSLINPCSKVLGGGPRKEWDRGDLELYSCLSYFWTISFVSTRGLAYGYWEPRVGGEKNNILPRQQNFAGCGQETVMFHVRKN